MSAQGFQQPAVFEVGKILGVPENDIHGSIFFMLKAKIDDFCRLIGTLNITFGLYQVESKDLPEALQSLELPEQLFDRTGVSSIIGINHDMHICNMMFSP